MWQSWVGGMLSPVIAFDEIACIYTRLQNSTFCIHIRRRQKLHKFYRASQGHQIALQSVPSDRLEECQRQSSLIPFSLNALVVSQPVKECNPMRDWHSIRRQVYHAR